MNARMRWGLLAALLVLLADQGSKWWVLNVLHLRTVGEIPLLPVFSLRFVQNQGVTFGLFQQSGAWEPWLLAAVALAVVAVLAVWLRRAESLPVALSLGAIAGGAVGNVIDRVRFGAVVDFLHAHAFGYSWYVFNMADAAIVCGVGVLVLDGLRPKRLPAETPPRLQTPGLRQ